MRDARLQIVGDVKAWKWSIKWSLKNDSHPMANLCSKLIARDFIQGTNDVNKNEKLDW